MEVKGEEATYYVWGLRRRFIAWTRGRYEPVLSRKWRATFWQNRSFARYSADHQFLGILEDHTNSKPQNSCSHIARDCGFGNCAAANYI